MTTSRSFAPLVALLAALALLGALVLTGLLTTAGHDRAGASWNKAAHVAGASWNRVSVAPSGASWN